MDAGLSEARMEDVDNFKTAAEQIECPNPFGDEVSRLRAEIAALRICVITVAAKDAEIAQLKRDAEFMTTPERLEELLGAKNTEIAALREEIATLTKERDSAEYNCILALKEIADLRSRLAELDK